MTRTRLLIVALLIAASVSLIGAEGCITTSQGAALQQEIDRVKEDLRAVTADHEALKASINSTGEARGNLFADVTELQTELEKLRGAIDDVQFELGRVKDKVEQNESTLNAVLINLETRVQLIERKLGIESAPVDFTVPIDGGTDGGAVVAPVVTEEDDKDAYDRAYAAYQSGQYESSRALLRAFLDNHPRSRYAGNAQFWIGETYFKQADYDNAILEYYNVITQYPGSNKIASAYLKMGLAFEEKGDTAEARQALERVIQDFPNSDQAGIARRKLEQLR